MILMLKIIHQLFFIIFDKTHQRIKLFIYSINSLNIKNEITTI